MARILIIEDSRTQAAETQLVLEDRGDIVEVAVDGESGLKRALTREFDLVVSDILMPGMNGFEVCRAIKSDARTADLPVLLLTTLASPADILEGLEAGADNYVLKPYDPAALCRRIDESLASAPSPAHTEERFGLAKLGGRQFQIAAPKTQVLRVLVSSLEDIVVMNERLGERESELARQNAELARLNAEKNRMLGMAAHDLRNPIGVVKSVSDFLLAELDSMDGEERLTLLQTVRRTSDFMLRLVNDLLSVSKIEAGHLSLQLVPTDLAELATQNVELNRLLAGPKQITIDLDVPEPLPLIKVDRPKMEQVLSNLISNAVKFSTRGTTVTVRAVASERFIRLSVQDRGQGIPPAELGKLFVPFQTTSVRGTEGEQSTGLGLAIVHRIVQGHGGTISVDSEVGRGSTFTCELPLEPRTAASPDAVSSAS